MPFRRLSVELTADTAPYAAKLTEAAGETRAFGATAAAAGAQAQAGFDVATAGAAGYTASVTESAAAETRAATLAEAAVARKVAANAALMEQAVAYRAISVAAVEGSAQQVAADRLLEVANKKLAASGLEVVGANEAIIASNTATAESTSRVASSIAGRTGIGSLGAGNQGIALAALAVGLFKTTAAASDLTESVNKSVEVFGEADSAVLKFGATASHSLGQTRQQAIEATATFGNLLRATGANQADAAKMSIALVKLATDLASFNNVSSADALQDLQSGLVGQERPLRQYGILIDEASVKTKAYQMGIAEVGTELTQQEKLQARYALIFDQTKTAQGDFARTSGEVANQTRTLTATLGDMAANIGSGVLPVVRGVEHGFIALADAEKAVHVPIIEIGITSLAAATGIRLLAGAFASEAASATASAAATQSAAAANVAAGVSGAAAASRIGLAAASLQLAGMIVAVKAGQEVSKLDPVEKLDASIARGGLRFADLERHIPMVGNMLADMDDKLNKNKLAHLGLGDAVDKTKEELEAEATATAAATQETARHNDAMTKTASSIGLSATALADNIAYGSQVAVDAFAAEEEAAKKFAAAVEKGTEASAGALAKSFDIVGHFSTSSLESAAKATTKAAGTVEKDDSRVADSIQRVADLQEQFAEQAATARESYAAKVEQTNRRLTDAEQSYVDTVESANQRIRDADQKLADDRISLAQSVVDAEKRLEEDRLAGQHSVADAEQRLADEEARQHLSRNPAALKRLNDAIQLRDAHAAIGKAQESAAAKEQSDLDAIAKAKDAQTKTLAKDQETADRARIEAARSLEKAEDAVTKARQEQAKLAEEGLHLGELTLAQQRQMRDAVDAVAKAQADSAKQAVTSTGEMSAAIALTVDDVKKFYADSLAQGTAFAEGIHTAIMRGYDPAFIAHLMEEGPKEAAPMLALIASQSDNALRDIVNTGEKRYREMALHLADTNRLVEIASHTSSKQTRDDFELAMQLLGSLATKGGHDTAENLARELGIGVEKVKSISEEYGGALAAGINPVLAGVGAQGIAVAGVVGSGQNARDARGDNYSVGGQVPGGYGSQDDVPAMLTRGEVVFSVPAVQKLGANNLIALHDQARRGYAEGGFVTAGAVPLPPDLSAYGDKVGYAGTKVDQYAYDSVVAWLNGGKAGGSGAPAGPIPSGEVADWVAAGVALAGKPSSWVPPEVNIAMFESSGDPHAQNNWDSNAAAGTPSKGLMQTIDSTFQAYMVAGHGDIWNPIDNVAAATNYIESRYGTPWNTPGERSLARGGAYQGYELGGLVDAMTVGVMDKGGFLEPGWNLNYNGLGVREPVGAMAAAGGATGGGDIIINVRVDGSLVGSTKQQVAEWLAEPLRAIGLRRGRNNIDPYFGVSRAG